MKRSAPRPPKSWELWTCEEHGLILLPREEGGRLEMCVACDLGVEVRFDEAVGGSSLTDHEFRNRIEWSTLEALVPLMQEYLRRKNDPPRHVAGPLFVTHAAWLEGELLPAGYSEPERFLVVLGYRWGALVKFLLTEDEGRQTIDGLRKWMETA